MENTNRPDCDHGTAPDGSCSRCGQVAVSGAAGPHWVKPPPPPEAAAWIIEPVPPELAEEFRRTFDEASFVADLEETLGTGGVNIDDLLAELEDKAHGDA